MVKFDDADTARLLRKKKLSLNISYILFALLLVSAVIAAVLARGAYDDELAFSNHIYVLAVAAVFLVALIAVIIFYVAPTERALKLAVNTIIAKGLLAREDFFKGGDEIEFFAEYSGDILTLSRKNYTGEISLIPSRLSALTNLGDAGAKIEFDLKPLSAVPALYATAGTRLWQFLQAYYSLHGKDNGVKSVKITDYMGKKPTELVVFAEGVATKNSDKNYFIKKGLIK